jgi:hypothetical protein
MPCLAPRLVLPKIIPSFYFIFFYFVIPNQFFLGGEFLQLTRKKGKEQKVSSQARKFFDF